MGSFTRFVLSGLIASASLACAGGDEVVLPLPNAGFEDGLEGWESPEGEGMSTLSDEQAATGKYSLKIVDTHPENGSNVHATRVPIKGAGAFELRGRYFPVSGSGLGVYVRVYDEGGNFLNSDTSHLVGLGGTDQKWRSFARPFFTTDQARSVELWVHSYSHAKVEAYLDDFQFVSLGDKGMKPPWQGQYKIRPEETDRLTPADVVGPDGIVYPNWTKCGVQGGIPEVEAFTRIEDFGGKADDDADDSEALTSACQAAGEAGGGAVLLAEGTYYLDRPVTVRHDNVVIRGQGADKTRLIFRYAIPDNGVGFFTPAPGSRVGKATRLEMHCRPTGLMKMTMMVDDVVIGTWQRSTHSGNTFAYARYGRYAIGKLPDGPHALKGIAEYKDGSQLTGEIPIVLDASFEDDAPVPNSRGAITFEGAGWAGPKLKLAENGKRGDLTLTLESVEGLEVGDCILVDGPATEHWKALTKNACKWGTYRRYEITIEGIEGNTLTINQPLRIEFPVIDGSYVQKIVPIQRCGVEDLYIEQTENLWISSVLFSHGWNCWARGVTVKMCGRFPVYGRMAKWCEIRDCMFDDAWFKGGGGTAYTGWDHCWDCLMENVETFVMRHGPLFQWAAAGNVIRKSVFHDSDGQWHSGWTNENLIEQCVIESVRDHGSYGYGMWASPPEDTAHGPNGPRNVVYNCDVSSPRTGLWMGGMNENWLILHSRFVVDEGQGVFGKTASFDHIIKGNVFVLRDEKSPMVFLGTPDCIGVEIIGNRLYGGNGKFTSGLGKPAMLEGNEAFALGDAPRPEPEVPSIYEWQALGLEARATRWGAASQEASGYRWSCVTENAAFAARDGAGALVFKDRMWLLGGWNPGDKVHFPQICNSEVWSSSDGATWRLENPQAPWEGRHTAGYVVHDGRMWIVGGDPNQGHYQNDVWSSADGVKWDLVNSEVPWAPRALHCTVAFDDTIWVMGGQTLPQFAPAEEAFFNDVWRSADGTTWTRVTEHAPWSPRGMIGGRVVFEGRMWLLGGGTYDTPTTPSRSFYNDVWSSDDGVSWERHAESTPWEPRQYHEVAVFDGKMWVLEGYNAASGNRRDVWYSADGVNWHELPDTPWAPRHAASVFVYDDALWMVAGNNMSPDVWKLTRTR